MGRFARLAAALAVAAVIAGVGCIPLKQQQGLKFDPALMRSPPDPLEVSIELLSAPVEEGNARLRVRFKDKTERKSLVIEGGAGPTLLRDADERAGDGVFSAFVHFDAKAQEVELERRARATGRFKEVPVFRNRQLVGTEPVRAEVVRFKAGEAVQIARFRGFPWLVDPVREL